MSNKDQILLEKAYLSIAKPMSSSLASSKDTEPSKEVEEIISAGPVDEPAPGVDVEMVKDEPSSVQNSVEMLPETPPEVSLEVPSEMIAQSTEDDSVSEEEREEDEMAIDNLNSIRESIMKIASFCATGGHLETWQQQKLAIAMDNLAGVARSLR